MATRVLVVDDDAMVLRATARILKRAGFDVTTSQTSDDALFARSAQVRYGNAGGFGVDVVVSDLEMPGMHGDALCRAWRELDICPTPFILLSGSDTVFERARACGARAAFSKPVDPGVLVEAVRDAAKEVR